MRDIPERIVELELKTEQLRKRIEESMFEFETTADVGPLENTVGQERALRAIRQAMALNTSGFNVYACGETGTGRRSSIIALATEEANERSTPSDWCYAHNFDNPRKPMAIELPPGKGCELAKDMEGLIEECKSEIPKAFEGEHFEREKNEAQKGLQEKRGDLMSDLQEKAKELNHTVRVTPMGIVAVPVHNGEPVSPDDFEKLDPEVREDLEEKQKKMQELIAETVSQARSIEKEAKDRAQEMERKVGLFAVGHLIEQLTEKYKDCEKVGEYLERVKQDIIENVEVFRSSEEDRVELLGVTMPKKLVYNKYRVNVVADNSDTEGAPVVEEPNPSYGNLFGQLEYRAIMGGMTTDFTMIKSGAFHRANGGFLVLKALDVLRHPFAWETLKRTIRTREAKIESAWEQYVHAPAATLEPEPIPVHVKVLLIGSPLLYYLLYQLDEDFRRLFKIKADFDFDMDFSDEHLEQYASFVKARCDEGNLPAFDRGALARLTEFGLRLGDSQERLSTCFLHLADIIAEAAHAARDAGAERVAAEHVAKALDLKEDRSRLLQDRIQRLIREGSILIDTDGATPGQVNGLAVYDLGDYRFAKPSRITCVTSVGRAGVVNIERESKMSGRIHDKAVLILSGYLAGRFGQNKLLSLSASLCFEQSYGQVEGDSASCAELFALLSSLAALPLRQDIAVTGSINQHGQVQPIGGVNEKIEGFFEVCRQIGLTGDQGVLIPKRNRRNLMVDRKVIDAVEEGRFHVWAIDDVAEGIEVLAGVAAGELDAEGNYPEDTVFGRVDRRLREMAEVLKQFGQPPPTEAKDARDAEAP